MTSTHPTPDSFFSDLRALNVKAVTTALTQDPSLVHQHQLNKSALVISRELTSWIDKKMDRHIGRKEAQMEILLLAHGASVLDLRHPTPSEDAWKMVHNTVFECFNRVAEKETTVALQQQRLHAWLSAMPEPQRITGLTHMANAWLKNLDDRAPLDTHLIHLSEVVLNTLFQFNPTPDVFEGAGPSGTHSVARRQVDERLQAQARAQESMARSPERLGRRRLRT